MNVVIFGASGMVGQGVLRECLADPGMERVLSVGRRATGQQHAKLRELVHGDMHDFSAIESELAGLDACFFCLGVTSAGMSEADYRRVTVDIAVAAAKALLAKSPGLTFVFVSGAGTDSSGRSRTMWARVKGEAENALLAMPFKGVYMFRPAFIQPGPGIVSRTPAYRFLYALLGPLHPLLKTLFPKYVTTTEQVGRAMIHVARHGHPKRVLENRDIDGIRSEVKGQRS
jgi:uncharacterized protein YbjT (DUF2867 family)